MTKTLALIILPLLSSLHQSVQFTRDRLTVLIVVLLFSISLSSCGSSSHSNFTGNPSLQFNEGQKVDINLFSNFSSAVAVIGNKKASLVISAPQKVNNMMIPANLELQFKGNGKIDVSAGKALVIDSSFDAPLEQIFTGDGKIQFTRSALSHVHPEWWGAGDRKLSAEAIQKSIDSLEKGDVKLSAATYLLDQRRRIKLIGSGDAVDTVLVPKSNVSIIGDGYDSVLKVVDSFTSGGDYVLFAPLKAEPVSNITIKNLRIDGNGEHNLVNGMTGNQIRRAMAIWLFSGEQVRVEKVWFENHPGANVVKLGSDNLSYLVENSSISDCTFTNVGGAIPGNRQQTDHSSIYVSGRNVTVANNYLSNQSFSDANGPPAIVVAGIEMHGDDMMVTGNSVDRYGIGGYIVGDGIVTAVNQRWTNNTFTNVIQLGISIWSISRVENILLESNRIELDGKIDQGVAGIFQSLKTPDTTLGIDNITIRNNTILGKNTKAGTVWNGIQLTAARDAVVDGNVIESISGAGIAVMGTDNKLQVSRNIHIMHNIIRDTSFNAYNAYPYAIEVANDGLGRLEKITVHDNQIENTKKLTESMGGIRVKGKGLMKEIMIDNNRDLIKVPQKKLQIDSLHDNDVIISQ